MSIPPSQLETWTNYETAAVNSARYTNKHIRENLEDSSSRLHDHNIQFDTLLQGSYANDTIIRSSSDVDILIRLQDPFYADKNELSQQDIDNFYQPGHYTTRDDYSFTNFRNDVINELKDVYGQNAVNEGNKAIELESSALSLDADVVPVQEYRYYNQYTGYDNDDDYIRGIVFWSNSGGRIRNYPEQHLSNATKKHQRTNERYKPTVRMIKNARNRMDEKGIFPKDKAPSYFIECLLWNVPDEFIDTHSLQSRYVDVVNHLLNDDFDSYRQQHNLLDLFGYSNTNWSKSNAIGFVNGLVEMWENW